MPESRQRPVDAPKPRTPTRRTWLAAAATTAAGVMIVPSHVLAGSSKAPSEKLNVAAIGVGGMGFNDVRNVGATETIVAICDVDRRHVDRSLKVFPQAKVYADFRELLDQQKDLDAVTVATPDHLHAAVTMAAMKAGKHVYCEKPLTHTVAEARAIRDAARKYKVATQMGNQGQATEEARLVSEMIWDGAIGTVKEIHAWSNRKPDISQRGVARPKDTPPVPDYLDWDRWVGPAPMRPYHPSYLPFTWRGWWDFGSGVLGDIGCHQLFTIFRTLKLGLPSSIESSSTNWQQADAVSQETAPLASVNRFKFAATADHGPVEIVWYDGGIKPPRPEELEAERTFGVNDGTLIVGDRGKILDHRLIPEKRRKEYGKPPQKLERSVGHYKEWIDACKGGKPAGANFADSPASIVTETILLGNVSLRSNKRLEYDGEKGVVTNDSGVNALLNPPRRAGWEL
jgi:predicted dehydrogenase